MADIGTPSAQTGEAKISTTMKVAYALLAGFNVLFLYWFYVVGSQMAGAVDLAGAASLFGLITFWAIGNIGVALFARAELRERAGRNQGQGGQASR